ncbi:UDP-N-acetylmuramoyl-tripeptide--D-alanyl-D-alanine ligase [Corynebacterium pseudopelargi]|uniref:UDP-N-acetylmuramoyl-tripeptide--D-alanyl-D-alanine ligase n=1 Tax=Corynebacterium pseudopelargi TaxID=2080757 RepID=A0A3G6IY74_9CORY|nr:UDP-N-acetylmuramoyl-tripeptide--D-alanyl-D-alanine ligase [Corynebacterium pseudopelargi]AZA08924.1 UDP-N-acetylmuramoyl-tripeptide--D-alanyl-D-alanine ligase [Corynebacterium pseudopelargi]
MIPLDLASIAQACGGTLSADATGNELISGKVEFDSRKISQGDLFVALHGARVDGHDFAQSVMQAGAAGALVFRDVGVPAVIAAKVEQTGSNAYATAHDSTGAAASVIAAMSSLARYVCDQLTPELCVVGVTGSAGKTSAKDMMASIFSAQAPTVAPPGSFNNEIGHPYTVLRCDADTRFLVSELSARGVGHIRALTQVAPPRIGVVLNVGSAHLGEFGSQATIAKAKGELVEALPADGVAVLNADDPLVAAMASRTKAKVCTFGTADNATVRASDIRLNAQAQPAFHLHTPEGEAEIQLNVSGEHQVWNALAAIAAALAAGVELATAVDAIQAHRNASAHRMDVRHRADGLTVIDDAYNANAESMRAGIRAAVSTAQANKGKAIAVLGPMGELGEDSSEEHERLGKELACLGIDKLVVVGDQPDAQALARGAGALTEAVTQTPEQAAGVVEKLAGSHDTVLVKASNAFQLWRAADALMANHATNEAQQEQSELQVNDK